VADYVFSNTVLNHNGCQRTTRVSLQHSAVTH